MTDEQRCPSCGHPVTAGAFCSSCGSHLPSGSRARLHAFAAAPGEHVLAPHIVSTLFPHASRQARPRFAWALGVAALALIVLGLLRLTGPTVLLAAAAFPFLYLLYLWETAAYRERPALVFLATAVLGGILGALWAEWTGSMVSHAHLLNLLPHGAPPADGLRTAILVPLGGQVLMLIGALALLLASRDHSALDGYVLGAASALGFFLGATLVELVPELQSGLVSVALPFGLALRTIQRGLFVPAIDAMTTGLVAGALWLQRLRPERQGWLTHVLPAMAAAAAAQIAVGLVAVYVVSLWVAIAITLGILLALLIWTRLTVHRLLLAPGGSGAGAEDAICAHCGRPTGEGPFCPECGLSVAATPHRTGARRIVPAWLIGGGALAAGAVVLAVVALALAPGRVRCERLGCTAPPTGASLRAPGLPAALPPSSTYTSPDFGFSLLYPSSTPPAHTDTQSVEWEGQLSDGSVVAWTFYGVSPDGKSPDQIVADTQSSQFPDANYDYTIPGAELGYTPGYGRVYDVSVAPDGGSAIHARLLVVAAVKNNVGVVFVGVGSYQRSTPQTDGHPNPADTPLVSLGSVEEGVTSVSWSGNSGATSP